MSAPQSPPLLRFSPLTGTVYIITRYKVAENGIITAQRKFDVTEDFLVAVQR